MATPASAQEFRSRCRVTCAASARLHIPEEFRGARNVRFADDGTVRRGQETVALLSPPGQDAVARLGRLGCTEVDFSFADVMIQMPYQQTPEQLVALLPGFAEAGDALAQAVAAAAGDQHRQVMLAYEPAAPAPSVQGGVSEKSGSVGPPRS